MIAATRRACALAALASLALATPPAEDPRQVVQKATRSVRLFETKLAAAQSALRADERSQASISPALEGTDEKFFDGHRSDYGGDKRPVIKDDFMYPYPAIQTNDNFDEDFVRDDNKDDGQYEAMMRYDSLRAKLHLLQEKVKESESKVVGEGQVVADYRAKLKAAKAAMRLADADLAKAQKVLRQWEAKDKAVQMKINAQQKVVARERKEFEECKKKLAEAQANFAAAQASFATNQEVQKMEKTIEKTDRELHAAAARLRTVGGKVDQADLPRRAAGAEAHSGARGRTALGVLGLVGALLAAAA